MARIYLSYSHKDVEFAKQLSDKLKSAGHEILVDTETLVVGQDWRFILSEGLKSADAFVVLLSAASLASQYTMMEVGTARAHSAQAGKPIIIPVAIDDIQIPLPLQDIQILFASHRNTDEILFALNRSLAYSAGQEAAKEKKAEETAKKIESNAAAYIQEAINAQRLSYERNNRAGKLWYMIGFVALVTGIGFALASLRFHTLDPNWISLITVVLTNIIVIGFLGACSRYAFSLGKAYISEALKASDRIHAIEFGRFYLRSFGERANWAELKEVFQHWNIDRASTFSALDTSQIDPQIMSLAGQIAAAVGSKGKSAEK